MAMYQMLPVHVIRYNLYKMYISLDTIAVSRDTLNIGV